MAHEQGDRLALRLHEELGAWHPHAADQLALKAEYEQFLTDGRATAVERGLGRAHVTGSAFVFTPDLQNVLLGFHKKAGF